MFRLITGIPGPSGFGSASTAEQVTEGIDASRITAIVTGIFCLSLNVMVENVFVCSMQI